MGLNCPVSWGGRGADGWAAGDAASCPAMPAGAGAVAGVTSWLGLSAGWELAARPGPVPVEPVRERLGCHLLPGSKQLLFGRVGARRQHVAIGHGTGCVPSPRTMQGDGFLCHPAQLGGGRDQLGGFVDAQRRGSMDAMLLRGGWAWHEQWLNPAVLRYFGFVLA